MSRRICIVAATAKEIEPLQQYLEANAVKLSSTHFQIHNLEIDILISGIGILHTTYSLMNYLMYHQPHAWIQMGIGGAFDSTLEIGNVYLIESEVLVDFGAQDKDGRILSQFQLGWIGSDQFPYSNETLHCPYIPSEIIFPIASGMTTIYSHGFFEKIQQLNEGLHGQIENMEGASFFYVSLLKSIPFLSIRSISNYVSIRDTGNWNIPLAIDHLNQRIISFLKDNVLLQNLFGDRDI